MRIDEFLLARIAEDEAVAWRGGSQNNGTGAYANDNYGCLLVDPTRVAAECEAKRAIVEAVTGGGMWDWRALDDEGRAITGALAAIYADHPDYRDDWRA